VRRIEVPATIEHLASVNAFVRRLAADARFCDQETYKLRLMAEELYANIVQHGFPPGKEGAVIIEGEVQSDQVWLRLIDNAAPFDPFQRPEPTGLDLPLDEREPGSLGLYLVRQTADVTAYEYVDNANRTTVVVRRADPNVEK
jgi:serine/threonine-protein kinase RsbW